MAKQNSDIRRVHGTRLNINVEYPRDEREAAIADLLDEINLVDTSQNSHFGSAACRRHGNNAPGVINVGGAGFHLVWADA